jgi:hypothetical protein
LTATAVNVTDAPSQTLLAEAAMLTLTGNTGFTVILIALEVAGLPVVQVTPEVSSQVIKSPFAGMQM